MLWEMLTKLEICQKSLEAPVASKQAIEAGPRSAEEQKVVAC